MLPKNRGFCGPQTSSMKKEKTPLTKHTVSFLFLLFFFLCCVSKAIYSSRRPLFERGEEPHQTSNTLSLSFSHVVESNERAQSTKKKRPCLLCVVRFVAASHKKDIPHQSKVPDDTRRQRERTRRQQTTTTTTTTTNDALWRKERRHFWTTTTTTTTTTGQQMNPLRANDDALKQIMRRVFEEIKPFVTRHEPDVPEEDLPELSRTRDLSKADFTVQWSRFCAKRKVNPAEYVKNLSETIQRQIEEDGNRDGFIKSVQGVGPYMNIFVKRQKVFKLAINAIIEQGTKYGCTNAGQGKKLSSNTRRATRTRHCTLAT